MSFRNVALIILSAGLLYGAWLFWVSSNDQSSAERAYEGAGDGAAAPSGLVVPVLSAAAEAGRAAFNARCSVCHGRDAGGGTSGPPLIHKIYEPSHHGDESFRRAVAYGVRAHHWGFGDMPAQDGVEPEAVENIIAFVRETQRANGID
ncbi:MAG: cytochrome c [Pseudomonadota bacterium]